MAGLHLLPQNKYLFGDLTIPAELSGLRTPVWSDVENGFIFNDDQGRRHGPFRDSRVAMHEWHCHIQQRLGQLLHERETAVNPNDPTGESA